MQVIAEKMYGIYVLSRVCTYSRIIIHDALGSRWPYATNFQNPNNTSYHIFCLVNNASYKLIIDITYTITESVYKVHHIYFMRPNCKSKFDCLNSTVSLEKVCYITLGD